MLVESRTTATLVLIAVGLWVLVLQARPFNWWKTVLVASMIGSVALILVIPWLRDFYALQFPPAKVVVEASIVAAIAIALLEVGWRLSRVVANRRVVACTATATRQSQSLRLNMRYSSIMTTAIEPSANG